MKYISIILILILIIGCDNKTMLLKKYNYKGFTKDLGEVKLSVTVEGKESKKSEKLSIIESPYKFYIQIYSKDDFEHVFIKNIKIFYKKKLINSVEDLSKKTEFSEYSSNYSSLLTIDNVYLNDYTDIKIYVKFILGSNSKAFETEGILKKNYTEEKIGIWDIILNAT